MDQDQVSECTCAGLTHWLIRRLQPAGSSVVADLEVTSSVAAKARLAQVLGASFFSKGAE